MKWLHISDIHFSPLDSAGTKDARSKLLVYIEKNIEADHLFITGDYRHKKKQDIDGTVSDNELAKIAADYIKKIADAAKVKYEKIHLVPGNHDMVQFSDNSEDEKRLAELHTHYKKNCDMYSAKDFSFLYSQFDFFKQVYQELNIQCGINSRFIDGIMPNVAHDTFDEFSLIYLNSCMFCHKKIGRGHFLFDTSAIYNAVQEIIKINQNPPIFILAHHEISDIDRACRKEFERAVSDIPYVFYLCGDAHDSWVKLEDNIIQITAGCMADHPEVTTVFSTGVISKTSFAINGYQWSQGSWAEYPNYANQLESKIKNWCKDKLAEINVNNSADLDDSTQNEEPLDENYIKYYEFLWHKFSHTTVRDGDASKLREIIDFYIYPSFKFESMPLSSPLKGNSFRRLILAGSGIGKTLLLQSIVVVNIIKYLYEKNSQILDENAKKNFEQGRYKKLLDCFAIEESSPFIPIFISANKANLNKEYSTVFELADCNTSISLQALLNNSQKKHKFLFLIDSVDEIADKNLEKFLICVDKLSKEHPLYSIIITSRYVGKTKLMNYEQIELNGFNDTAIKQLSKILLSENKAENIVCKLFANKYLYEMARNPYMLTEMLGLAIYQNKDMLPYMFLDSIVNAIIDRRWRASSLPISADGIRLLLGYIAWKMLFGNTYSVEKKDLNPLFYKAHTELSESMYGDEFTLSNQNIRELANSMSYHSGILNLIDDNHVEKYVFQDRLVMCFLAAEYFCNSIATQIEKKIIPINVAIISNFIDATEKPLNENTMCSLILAMSFSLMPKNYQQSLLNFILLKGTISLDHEEVTAVAHGLIDLTLSKLGYNYLTNKENNGEFSNSSQIIAKFIINNIKVRDSRDSYIRQYLGCNNLFDSDKLYKNLLI